MAFPYHGLYLESQDGFNCPQIGSWSIARCPSPLTQDHLNEYAIQAQLIDRPGTPFMTHNHERENRDGHPMPVRSIHSPTPQNPLSNPFALVDQTVREYDIEQYSRNQFHAACEMNNAELVRVLVESMSPQLRHDTLSSLNANGKTALMTAVENGRDGVVRYLLTLDGVLDPTVSGEVDSLALVELAREKGFTNILIDLQDKVIYNLQLKSFNQRFSLGEHDKMQQIMEAAHEEEKNQLIGQIKKLRKRERSYHSVNRYQASTCRSVCHQIDWKYQMHQQEARLSARILNLEQELLRKNREIVKWQKTAQMYQRTNCQLPLHATEDVTEDDPLGIHETFREVTASSVENFQLAEQVQSVLVEMMEDVRSVSKQQSVKACLQDIVDAVIRAV